MLSNIIFFLVVFLAIGAIYIQRRPGEFRITRSLVINSEPAIPYEHVNDLHKWAAWSPWAGIDPNAKITFQGPDTGVGSIMKWDGNKKQGTGIMEIIESRPNEFIKFRLEFIKPFKAVNTTEFMFEPVNSQTKVTWSMYGKNNYIGKALSVIMNCDDMLGGQFNKGLGQLKAVCENTGTA